MNYGNTVELKNFVPKLGYFVSFNYTSPPCYVALEAVFWKALGSRHTWIIDFGLASCLIIPDKNWIDLV